MNDKSTKKINMVIDHTQLNIAADQFSDDEINVISRFISAVNNEAKAKSLRFDAVITESSEWHSRYDFSELVVIKDKVDGILSRINRYASFEINSNYNLPLDVAARLTIGSIFDDDKIDDLIELYETGIVEVSCNQKGSYHIDFSTKFICVIPDTINNLLSDCLDPNVGNIWIK